MARSHNLDGLIAYGEVVFGYRPASHHIELLKAILEAIRYQRDTVILLPAGAGKTTWGNTITLTWLISLFANIRIGLFSETADFAHDFSRAIMQTIGENEQQNLIFGNLSGDVKWTKSAWIRSGSSVAESKDLTMLAGGTGGQVASKRFDLLFCDDILGESNTGTTDQKEKVKQWWDKSLYPRLAAHGFSIVLGTRWEPEDLYETLMAPPEEGGYGFHSVVMRALTPDEDEPTGLRSYWPSVWPVERLLTLRERNRASFDCTYNNDVTGLLSGDIFQRKWFSQIYGTPNGDPEAELPEGRRWTKRMGVDLASSVKERADFTAEQTTAQDENGNFFVMKAKRIKIASGHADWIADRWGETQGIGLIVIENQQFQSTVVQDMLNIYPNLPVVGRRADNDKVTRATAVAAKYENHKVWIHASLFDSDWMREHLAFKRNGVNAHDDWVDADGYSMELAGGTFFFGGVKSKGPGTGTVVRGAG